MPKSNLTLFGIPARYSPFSMIKIRYNIQVVLFTKVLALVVQIILEKQYAMLKQNENEVTMKVELIRIQNVLNIINI